jgi:diacylglycerol O-acyltransferase / wax synthase
MITRGFRDLLRSRGEATDGRVIRTLVPVSVRARSVTGPARGDGTMETRV